MLRIRIMGILNMTPDSFSDGGRLAGVSDVLKAAEAALHAGADILDVGGESTRPGALPVDTNEELRRILPVLEALHREFPQAVLSIDTRKALVAEQALQAGARMVNDVSGLQAEPAIAEVAAAHHAELVIMHSQGIPETMQRDPQYPQGVISEIMAFFQQQIILAEAVGVRRERLILDPGFGFGKTLHHNLLLLKHLNEFQSLRLPVLAGTSRKSFLTLGHSAEIPAQDREALTAATVALAIQGGASLIRVHDVATQASVVRLTEALLNAAIDVDGLELSDFRNAVSPVWNPVY